MSALSFKINAETDKLNSFITSLERLKQVLATIPSGTKEFDVVNQKIAEMEARVEQSIKRITQMQNEAAKTTTQTATSPTTPAGSATGIQAANAEAEAWRGLLDELKAASDAKSKAMIELKQYQNEVSRLKTEVALLNKEEQQTGHLSSKKRGQLLSASMSIEEYKQRISRLRRELANQIKLEQAATGSIDEMSQALARMRTIYRSLDEGERGSTFGQNLLKNIQALDTKIKELDASMGVHARNVGNYASGWYGLSFSIQQVARELPSLAISPQTFFLAISNNLPILADQLALTRQRVKELKAEGQSFTPVWKQVIKSIISWQTLLVAGITVLTLYGKEITEWVGSLFKGKQAFDAAKQAAEQFHATMTEGAISAQAEITKLDLLYRAATDVAKPYNERKKAVERLQEIYPAYFGNMSEEQIMVGDAISAYNNLRDAIIEAAQARAAQDVITEKLKDIKYIESLGSAYTDYSEALKEYDKVYAALLDKSERIGPLPGQGMGSFADISAEAKLTSDIEKSRKIFYDKLEKAGPEGERIKKIIKDKFDGDVNAFIEGINESVNTLTPAVEKLLTSSTVEEKNAEAEAARLKAEQDAQKAASQQEKNLNDLGKALQKLRDDALQAEIDSMKDGTEKRVAQIELDYQRRAEAINEAEQRIIELQGKLTQKQEEQFAILRQENDNRRKNERHEAIAGPPIEIDLAALWKKEQADWDEYYMKYGTFREKMQATKDYYDRKMVEATTEGARAAIQAERDAALAVFEVQASDWAKEIVNLSVEKLEELLSEVEAQLETAQTAYDALASSGTQEAAGYIDTINKLKARIAVLNALLGKTKKGVSDSNWAEGARLLNELSATAREAASALSEFDEGLGKAATFIATMASAAGNLIATIDGVTDAASAAGTAMSALEKASLVLTAISAGFQLIQGALRLFNFGPDYSEYEELKQQYEAINDIWDNLIDKKKEYIDISYGQEVRQTEQEIIDLVNKQTESYKELARARLNSGGSGTTRTIGRRIWRDMSAEGWAQAREALGNDVWKNEWQNEANRMMWLTDLSADQLRTLRDEASIFWTQLDGDVQNYLNSIIEGEEKIEDARKKAQEQRTQISFDSMYDNFISTLMDMDASAKDFSEDFSQYLMKAVLTAKVGTLLSDQLEGWYAAFDEAMKDGVLTEDETEKLREWWDEIVKSGLEMRDTIAQATGVENISSQSATSRGFQAMSQDTGSELNGRFTDIQGKVTDIRGYVMTETQSIIGLISSITSIQIAVIRNVQINNELLQYAVKTYLEVAEINATTQAMNDTLTYIREDITAIKRNTANI